MAIVVPEDYSLVTMVFNCAGVAKDITWSFGLGDRPLSDPAADAAAVASCFRAGGGVGSPGPYHEDNMSDAWTFTRVEVSKMTSTGPLVGVAVQNLQGDATLLPVPINCSMLLTKTTALGGRKYKGRAYLPPLYPGEDVISHNGSINQAFVDNLNDWYGNAYTELDGSALPPYLFHSGAEAPTLIAGWSVSTLIATQRRRLR